MSGTFEVAQSVAAHLRASLPDLPVHVYCPDYGIGDHDCTEHEETVVHRGSGPCDCWACSPEEP